MLTAHAAYLSDVRSGALLGRDAQAFRDSLDCIFACAQQLVQPLLDSEAHVAACAATGRKVRHVHRRCCAEAFNAWHPRVANQDSHGPAMQVDQNMAQGKLSLIHI